MRINCYRRIGTNGRSRLDVGINGREKKIYISYKTIDILCNINNGLYHNIKPYRILSFWY
jgi:hypothetical protein